MRLVTALIAALAALAVLAVSAQASFPGRNGGILFTESSVSGDSAPQLTEHEALVVALRPFGDGGRTRTLVDCERTDGVPSGGDCTGTGYRSASYSSDGKRIVFDAGARLALMRASGGAITLLPATTADDGDPSFSPDGEQIVFTGVNDHGGTDLYRRRLDTGVVKLIIQDASEPAWKGALIAYVRSGNVYTARENGGRRRWVSSGVSPDWSPDGQRLVLVRPLPTLTFDAPIGHMYIVNAIGRGLRRIRGIDDAAHPVWSPDGRWLAFESVESGVFAKRVGSRREPLVVAESQFSGESGSHTAFSPAWRPIPVPTLRGRSQPGR